MEIHAHRCRGFGFTENGHRAIRAALESKVDAIEIDVRLTKDKKWVAIHDPHYKDESKEVVRIHEFPYSRLKREVTLLDEILALFSAMGEGKFLYIDVKDVGETRQLVRLIKNHKVRDCVVVIAWEPEVLKRVHKEDPRIRIGLSYVPLHERLAKIQGKAQKPFSKKGYLLHFNKLHSFDSRFPVGKTQQHYLSEFPDLPLYSVQVFSLFCSAKLVKKAHEKGAKVIAFVVNNRLSATLLKKRGVNAILTNESKVFLK